MSLSKSININENYAAQVVQVKNLRNVPKADVLKMFTIQGCNILSSSVKENDLVVYFPVESQLDNKILHNMNLYSSSELNSDTSVKGFFNDKGRVRAIKLMKVPSEGFVLPVADVAELYGVDVSHLKLGAIFDSLNNEVIVKKYVINAQKAKEVKAGGPKQKKIVRESRMVDEQFKLHRDTPKLAANLFHLLENIDSLIYITWKLHGTSFVSSRVLTKKKLSMFQSIFKWAGADVVTKEYSNVYSSRKVIKNEYFEEKAKNYNHFYGVDIWSSANDLVKDNLLKGETLYGEIVGYLPSGAEIQKGYDYGCDKDTFDVYVYRITQTNEDGKVVELTYDQIVERTEQLGVKVVPLIWKGSFRELLNIVKFDYSDTVDEIGIADAVALWLKDNYVYDQDSIFCKNKVPEEGICLTIVNSKMSTYKLKSTRFLQHETKELDKGLENIEG